jgi:hypothetical protein
MLKLESRNGSRDRLQLATSRIFFEPYALEPSQTSSSKSWYTAPSPISTGALMDNPVDPNSFSAGNGIMTGTAVKSFSLGSSRFAALDVTRGSVYGDALKIARRMKNTDDGHHRNRIAATPSYCDISLI